MGANRSDAPVRDRDTPQTAWGMVPSALTAPSSAAWRSSAGRSHRAGGRRPTLPTEPAKRATMPPRPKKTAVRRQMVPANPRPTGELVTALEPSAFLCDSVAPGLHIVIRPRTPVGRARRSNRHRRPSSISGMDIDHPRFSAYVLPTRAGHIRCLRWSTPRWQSTSHSPSSCPCIGRYLEPVVRRAECFPLM